MLVKMKVAKEVDIRYLKVNAGVRYWEDATVNGVEDTNGDLIPCREGDSWCPIIDLDTGIITNWEQGKTADVHYKVCDAGIYTLLDAGMNEISEFDGYVPNILCPQGGGYGDYIILDIDATGKIQHFTATLEGLLDEED